MFKKINTLSDNSRIVKLDVQVFFVIPVKTGIHVLLRSSWIPGLRYAAPGMTGIPRSSAKKLEHRVIDTNFSFTIFL